MMKNDVLQWIGAFFVIAGHTLNSMGPIVYPYNIVAFLIGTVLFLVWTIRVKNHPQMLVNVISMIIGVIGMVNAFI